MVTLSSLSQEGLVLRQLFLIREGDAVHSLQRVVVGIAEEVGCGVLELRQLLNDEH